MGMDIGAGSFFKSDPPGLTPWVVAGTDRAKLD